jgi:hypothetical protein
MSKVLSPFDWKTLMASETETSGRGRFASAIEAKETVPSLLPVWTLNCCPPAKTVASLVAATMTSAQDTTPGQRDSRALLIWLIRSNPNTVPFGIAVFSLCGPSSNIDASQP